MTNILLPILIYFLSLNQPLPTGINEFTSNNLSNVVYLHGSEANEHDRLIAEKVWANVIYGSFCYGEDNHLLESANPGDIVITSRGDSLDCDYNDPIYPTYPVVGGSNTDEFLGDEPIPHAFVITNDHGYGHVIDYWMYDPEFGWATHNLGDAMAQMANMITSMNILGNRIISTQELKTIMDNTAYGSQYNENGEYLGEAINPALALEYAAYGPPLPPLPCTTCGFLPAIYYLLLL